MKIKAQLLLVLITLSPLGASAQGALNFSNAGVGVNAPVTNIGISFYGNCMPPCYQYVSQGPASGSGFLAQLYIGPANTASNLFTTNGVSGTPATFLTGAQAGYFAGGTRVISGIPGGTTIRALVRTWVATAGSSWETANVLERSQSSPIQITLTEAPTPPPNMVGLQGFTMYVIVPEPSSIALALLGLGAITLFHRRKMRG